MKIAIMMRAMDQDSGFRAITERLVTAMLQDSRKNSYLLLYRTAKWLGRFASYSNAKEKLVWAPHKFAWDQIAVPYRAWKEGADIIFNPKFSVPLLSHCPVTMGLQEPAWWTWPEHYEKWDIRYIKLMLPLYCRKAAHIFPNSNFILDENRKYLGQSFANSTVIYSAPSEHFRPENNGSSQRLLEKYQIPEKFIFSVTRVDHPGLENSTSFYAGKNVETTLRAFGLCRKQVPHKLVIAGRRVSEYLSQTGWTSKDLEDVHLLGFVPHEEIAQLYSHADAFVIPSLYEGCPSTLLEAMACGCPVVASQTGACPEISGGAALLADPHDPLDFASKIKLVLSNETLRQELKAKSLKRASSFSWEESARLVLDRLSQIVAEKSSTPMIHRYRA